MTLNWTDKTTEHANTGRIVWLLCKTKCTLLIQTPRQLCYLFSCQWCQRTFFLLSRVRKDIVTPANILQLPPTLDSAGELKESLFGIILSHGQPRMKPHSLLVGLQNLSVGFYIGVLPRVLVQRKAKARHRNHTIDTLLGFLQCCFTHTVVASLVNCPKR